MMLPRRYGTPVERLIRSVRYGRDGRGGSATRTPLSIPGDVTSEMNVRNPGAASCAATAPRASVTTVKTPAGLDRNIHSLGPRQAGGINVTAGVTTDRCHTARDRAALRSTWSLALRWSPTD